MTRLDFALRRRLPELRKLVDEFFDPNDPEGAALRVQLKEIEETLTTLKNAPIERRRREAC